MRNIVLFLDHGIDLEQYIMIGENRIYWNEIQGYWEVSAVEFEENGSKYYATLDGFKLLQDAIDCALNNLPTIKHFAI